ncbi:MAG: hypothetical protein ACYTGB_07570 [Planctomycetota bacterium]|jgi:hypothetical protein
MPVQIPDPLKRREVLYGETPPEVLVEHGKAYEEEGKIDEALQFYTYAKDAEGLRRVKVKAIEMGDAFLLKAVARELPDDVGEADWQSLITNAEKLGKELYAEQARKALEGQLEALEPEEKRGQGKA